MANTRDAVNYYGYYDDNGEEWAVLLTTSVAAAGGFIALTAPASLLSRRFKKRHIGLVEQTSKERHTIPISTIGNALYTAGGTVAFGGETCTVTGRQGESTKLGSRTPP